MKLLIKDKKKKAILILIVGILFIGITIIILLKERNNIYIHEKEYQRLHNYNVNFNKLKYALINEDYEFEYNVAKNKTIITYEGKRINNLYSGKENNNLFENKENLNIEYKYLDINRILDLFNNSITSNNNSFIYENDDIYAKIRVSIDNVVNIEVIDEKTIYQMKIYHINNYDVKVSE